VFHTLACSTICIRAYRKEPASSVFFAAKTEHIREAGRDVNIWRYADEPVAAFPQ